MAGGFFIFGCSMQVFNFIIKWMPYLAILVVYITGSVVDIMEVDAAQYASISREMLESGSYLEVYNRASDYLDKPPFLFWVSALSMKLFGVHNWSYKLPSILFSLLGIFSTYKLGSKLYEPKVGRTASLIFGTSLAMIVVNNDIKTDTILVSSIVFSIWMLVSYIETKKWSFLIGSAVGIAISLLTKGPIGIVMPILTIVGHHLIKGDLKRLIGWRWIPMIILVGIMLIPMCVGLYNQFGTEGLKFYFWTQSFGRITGESEWQNDTSVFFFGHVLLWSLLPWTFLVVGAFIERIKNFNGSRKEDRSEFYTLSGFVLVSIALSLSRFKLPHYIFIVFPLLAIMTSYYIHQLKRYVNWNKFQLYLTTTSSLLVSTILVYSFPEGGFLLPILLVMSVLVAWVIYFTSYREAQLIYPSFIMFISIGLALNIHFYPELLKYQANSVVGKWVNQSKTPISGFASGGHGLDYYAQTIVPWHDDVKEAMAVIDQGVVMYATQPRYNELLRNQATPDSIMELQNFEVQNLSIQFLNPKTREKVTRKNYLLFY